MESLILTAMVNSVLLKKASFSGSLLQIKLALLTLSGGANGVVTISFYTKKGNGLAIDQGEVTKRSVFWIDVSKRHKGTQEQNTFFNQNEDITVVPPPQSDDENSWRQWRLNLLQRRKELQNLKSKRKKQLKKAYPPIYSNQQYQSYTPLW